MPRRSCHSSSLAFAAALLLFLVGVEGDFAKDFPADEVGHGFDNIGDVQSLSSTHLERYLAAAQVLGKLKSIPEEDGTLLDHCMIVYGSGLSDGGRHNYDNLPILVAGKGCGELRPGRHLRYPNSTPLSNLWVSLLDRIGATVPTLGDSQGRLPNLSV